MKLLIIPFSNMNGNSIPTVISILFLTMLDTWLIESIFTERTNGRKAAQGGNW